MATTAAEIKVTLYAAVECAGETPQMAVIAVTPDLIADIARSLLAIKGLAEAPSYARVTMLMRHDFSLVFDRDVEGGTGEEDEGKSRFDYTSAWLTIEPDSIALELWESHGDGEMFGQVFFREDQASERLVHAAMAAEADGFVRRLA